MADALGLLRDAIIKGKPVESGDGGVINIAGVKLPGSSSTAYRNKRKKEADATYTLAQLWMCVQFRDKPLGEYVKSCTQSKIPAVRTAGNALPCVCMICRVHAQPPRPPFPCLPPPPVVALPVSPPPPPTSTPCPVETTGQCHRPS